MRLLIITQTKDYNPFYFNGENEDETATLNVNCGMFKMRAVFCLLFLLSPHPAKKKRLDEMLCSEELHWTNGMSCSY